MAAGHGHDQRLLREVGVKTFKQFLAERHIGDEAAIVPLLKECWNQGVESACLYLGHQEGLSNQELIDHGTRNTLRVKE